MAEVPTADSVAKILVVDDETRVVDGLKTLLEIDGYEVLTAYDGAEADKLLRKQMVSVALVDLVMPNLSGLELFRRQRNIGLNTQFIFITGKASIDTAVEAMKSGAYDYLVKPVDTDRLSSIIPKAISHYRLLQSHKDLQLQVKKLTRYDELIGQSPAMRNVYRMIDAVADSTANVIVTGESGTGKELVARAIHNKSNRKGGPFVAVNCAAFPKDILENELFGHERGAFTGALEQKQGCFEQANGGTLFLDEIGDMTPETQSKLLRVLETRSFRRLGGQSEIAVDVRFIAATHQDLSQKLREDLLYRISVVELDLPPLRERISDLSLLVAEFLRLFNEQNDKQVKGFSDESIAMLRHYSWPGNVRELRNVIERAVLLSQHDIIESGDLPQRLKKNTPNAVYVQLPLQSTLEKTEMTLIKKNLELVNYDKRKAAKILGISLKTLYNKLDRYGIAKKPA